MLAGLAFPHLAPGQKQKKPKSITTATIAQESAAASQKLLKMSANNERTFIMLKPDAVHRGLVGDIIKRFEKKGFKLVAMKMTHVSLEYNTWLHFSCKHVVKYLLKYLFTYTYLGRCILLWSIFHYY